MSARGLTTATGLALLLALAAPACRLLPQFSLHDAAGDADAARDGAMDGDVADARDGATPRDTAPPDPCLAPVAAVAPPRDPSMHATLTGRYAEQATAYVSR